MSESNGDRTSIFCGWCGGVLDADSYCDSDQAREASDHAACEQHLAAEPPRYCATCRRPLARHPPSGTLIGEIGVPDGGCLADPDGRHR